MISPLRCISILSFFKAPEQSDNGYDIYKDNTMILVSRFNVDSAAVLVNNCIMKCHCVSEMLSIDCSSVSASNVHSLKSYLEFVGSLLKCYKKNWDVL